MYKTALFHIIYWILAWILINILFGYGELLDPASLFYCSIILFIAAGISYWIGYFLIPRYLLRQRHGLFIIYLVFTIIVSLDLEVVITMLFMVLIERYEVMTFFHDSRDVYTLLSGTYFIVFLSAGIKLFEYWYTEQNRKQAAVKEKIEAELKLLKSQIHPHFLFNTLNNIYSLAMQKSDQAPDAVLKLSGLLDYLIYQGDNETVPLKKETELIRNYIELEKLRYGERLLVELNVEGDLSGIQLAPLLLIPLVENAFKHGISLSRAPQRLIIRLAIKGKNVEFYIENSIPDNDTAEARGGMGLPNLKARLDLLYLDRHSLELKNEAGIFSAFLELET